MKNFLFNKDIPFEILDEKSKRKVLAHSDQLMIVEVYFEKGGAGAPHRHEHQQITYIVSGKFEFQNGNDKRIVQAGDSIYFPSNVLHGTICLEKGIVLDTFTPARQDFLKQQSRFLAV